MLLAPLLYCTAKTNSRVGAILGGEAIAQLAILNFTHADVSVC